MGNCCTATEVQKGETETEIAELSTVGGRVAANSSPSASPAAISGTFYPQLVEGVDVMVIPQARTGIMCSICYQPSKKRFVLQRDALTRAIPLNMVQRVMTHVHDLKRVEGAASSLTSDEHCCALLLASQSCIGLRFPNKDHRDQFADVVSQLVLHYYQ